KQWFVLFYEPFKLLLVEVRSIDQGLAAFLSVPHDFIVLLSPANPGGFVGFGVNEHQVAPVDRSGQLDARAAFALELSFFVLDDGVKRQRLVRIIRVILQNKRFLLFWADFGNVANLALIFAGNDNNFIALAKLKFGCLLDFEFGFGR